MTTIILGKLYSCRYELKSVNELINMILQHIWGDYLLLFNQAQC